MLMAKVICNTKLKETSRFFFNNFLSVRKKIVILRHVLVRGNAINRESGENPGQTRYCNSYKTRQHNATVGTADGKALVSRISQETCQGNILFCSFRVILPQNSRSSSRSGVLEHGLLCNMPNCKPLAANRNEALLILTSSFSQLPADAGCRPVVYPAG